LTVFEYTVVKQKSTKLNLAKFEEVKAAKLRCSEIKVFYNK